MASLFFVYFENITLADFCNQWNWASCKATSSGNFSVIFSRFLNISH